MLIQLESTQHPIHVRHVQGRHKRPASSEPMRDWPIEAFSSPSSSQAIERNFSDSSTWLKHSGNALISSMSGFGAPDAAASALMIRVMASSTLVRTLGSNVRTFKEETAWCRH